MSESSARRGTACCWPRVLTALLAPEKSNPASDRGRHSAKPPPRTKGRRPPAPFDRPPNTPHSRPRRAGPNNGSGSNKIPSAGPSQSPAARALPAPGRCRPRSPPKSAVPATTPTRAAGAGAPVIEAQGGQFDQTARFQFEQQTASGEILQPTTTAHPLPAAAEFMRQTFAAPLRTRLDPASQPHHFGRLNPAPLQYYFCFHAPALHPQSMIVQRNHQQLRDARGGGGRSPRVAISSANSLVHGCFEEVPFAGRSPKPLRPGGVSWRRLPTSRVANRLATPSEHPEVNRCVSRRGC